MGVYNPAVKVRDFSPALLALFPLKGLYPYEMA